MIRQIVFVTLLVLALFSCKTYAQGGEYIFNGKGQPFLRIPPNDVEGVPYLFDKWMPGKVLTTSGKVYDNLKIKYDMNEDFVIFAYDSADEPLKFADEVKSFTFILSQPLVFYKGFPAIDNHTNESYYQVLSPGSSMLLKHTSKLITESKGYNTNVITKAYQVYNQYYFYKNGKIEKVDNPKKTLYTLAGDKKPQLDTYLKSNSINFKKDEDLAKMFNYYNTL